MIDAYEGLLAARNFRADSAQRAAAERLQRLYYDLLSFKVGRRSTLRRLFASPAVPRGVYFWGGVGRGKSFLMDCFFDAVPYRRKRRIHFHAFMHGVHQQLNELKGENDPLLRLAERIATEVRLLCFDEFHVSDIADAMILGRLLEALFARGVVFVMTSNYPPDRLYPNGLQRDNFLPTIALIKSRLDVLEIDAGVDYRLRTLEQVEIFHYPADTAAELKMAEYFAAMADGEGMPGAASRSSGARFRRSAAATASSGSISRPCAGAAFAERLPGTGARLSHGAALGDSQDVAEHVVGSSALYLAGRHFLRPQGQADRHRRLWPGRAVHAGYAGQRVFPHRQPSDRDAFARVSRLAASVVINCAASAQRVKPKRSPDPRRAGYPRLPVLR
jgi:predicted ATPase